MTRVRDSSPWESLSLGRDSESRTILVCAGLTFTVNTDGELTIPETPISISLAEVFSALGA